MPHITRVLELIELRKRLGDIGLVRAGLAIRPRHAHRHGSVIRHAAEQLALLRSQGTVVGQFSLVGQDRPVVLAANRKEGLAVVVPPVVRGGDNPRNAVRASDRPEVLQHGRHRRRHAAADAVLGRVQVVAVAASAVALVPVREGAVLLEARQNRNLRGHLIELLGLRSHQPGTGPYAIARPLGLALLRPLFHQRTALRRRCRRAHERRSLILGIQPQLLQTVRHVCRQHGQHRVILVQPVLRHVLQRHDHGTKLRHRRDNKARAVRHPDLVPQLHAVIVLVSGRHIVYRLAGEAERGIPFGPRASHHASLRRCDR